MIKRGFVVILFLLLLIFNLNFILASSGPMDNEFKKLANYAGEYETGNIDYVQLLIYISSIREKMNENLGASGKEMGGILKEEQLKSFLGTPTEETKWVWSESEEKEKKLDNPVPAWRKIIFDGRKIQIRLNAWPNIFSKKEFKEDNEDQKDKNKELEDLVGKLVYRLNFEIEFKRPEEQLNIQEKINEIKEIAQDFSLDSSSENAENLAKQSVTAEKTFKSYFEQSGEKCEDVMASIFGTENKKQTQKLLVQEINFCEGDNFEVIARLEMCDECEWNWINIDFRFEGRGPGFKIKEGKMNQPSPDKYQNMGVGEFEAEVKSIIDKIKQSCGNKDFDSIINAKSELWPLNDAWSQKSNDVWKELDKIYESQRKSMTQEQRQEFDQNYGWIKQEQEKNKKAKDLMKSNYESRKQFYSNLFSGYDIKESYYTQVEFQKRLIEEFKERGEEICNNNQDDNNNNQIDCADEQCGGKICGKGKNIQEGNETNETEVDFYCIEGECKAKEEIKEVIRNVSVICQALPSVNCSEGSKAFFSRYDNTNCPIETSCLKETDSCNVNEDCIQPACGIAECRENKCEVTQLTECRELECIEGDERICESDGRIVEICNNGFWEKTGECEQTPEIRNETIVGNECLSASDCGNDNICNNGMCQVLPQVIITEPVEEVLIGEKEQEQQTEEQTQEQNQQESNPIQEETAGTEQSPSESETTSESTSESTSGPSSSQETSVTGKVITGFDTEESNPSQELTSSPESNQQNQQSENQESNQQNQQSENQESNQQNPPNNQPSEQNKEDNKNKDDERRREEDKERRDEENERRNKENKERCEKECKRPCIEKCIRTECGEELKCVVEEAQKKCEESCKAEDDCIEKCSKGGDWWKEFENKDEHKEEKGVFQVGGSCRTSQGKTEGFIWFGGWGDPFQQIQNLKNKYYSGGDADWCKYDFENLKKQRQEFEKGFNQEFVTWFFEKYLTNSAENWEQSVSGIFELYWKDVENSREMAYRMQCLGLDNLPDVNLVNVKYESEYGSIEFWEEIKTVKLEGMDKEVQIVSPYMKVWVFPSKEFIIYEMKKSMKNHEFPGSSEEKTERKNQEGPTAEEREQIKQDKNFMEKIKEISKSYGGNIDGVIRIIDNGTTVFNLYAQVNENDIIKIEPMPPEEVPQEDVRIEIEFQKIYDMIHMEEKDMKGQRTESPPWDKKAQPIQKIKETVNNVKMFFKVRDMLNSAKVYPEAKEKEARSLMKLFFNMMMKSEKDNNQEMNKEGENNQESEDKKILQDEKNSLTGNVIFG